VGANADRNLGTELTLLTDTIRQMCMNIAGFATTPAQWTGTPDSYDARIQEVTDALEELLG